MKKVKFQKLPERKARPNRFVQRFVCVCKIGVKKNKKDDDLTVHAQSSPPPLVFCLCSRYPILPSPSAAVQSEVLSGLRLPLPLSDRCAQSE